MHAQTTERILRLAAGLFDWSMQNQSPEGAAPKQVTPEEQKWSALKGLLHASVCRHACMFRPGITASIQSLYVSLVGAPLLTCPAMVAYA